MKPSTPANSSVLPEASPDSELNNIYHIVRLSDTLITSGQPTHEQFSNVAAAGIISVINLALPSSSNAIPDEEILVTSLGMRYIHIPVVWEQPTQADLQKFFEAMDAQSGQKLLVHCAANMRVSAFMALYRILQLGWDKEKAFQDTYRIWDPFKDPVWGKFVEEALSSR